MAKAEARAEPRLAHSRKGTLTLGGISSACLVQDVSTKGFLIMSSKPFKVGDVLDLRCELFPAQMLECKIEVRHITDDCLGTRIVEITEAAARLCRQFIEEHYADRLKFEGR